MERKVEKIEAKIPIQPRTIRVAAYARVSSEKDEMLHSLSAQVSYYSNYIQSHNGWSYCGVYADEAKTGTKDSRVNFQKLLVECRAGNIDLVITKSISRFARNTVTLLQTVRELKSIGVDVYFEEQNIHSMSSDGELMLSILASYAQEESRSASENQKWRIRKNFEEGIPWHQRMYGYVFEDGQFRIVPEEAEVVKLIYDYYLSGKGLIAIEKMLNEKGYRNRRGKPWARDGIRVIINNYAYTGNLILQKTFVSDYILKEKRINNGELPKFLVENSHEAIIPLSVYEKVQKEQERRGRKINRQNSQTFTPLTGKIVCEKCGKKYRRKTTATGYVWICTTFNTYGKANCPSKQIPETTLFEAINEVTTDYAQIEKICAMDNNIIKIELKDGSSLKKRWKDRSRSESWTSEKREKARQQALARNGRK